MTRNTASAPNTPTPNATKLNGATNGTTNGAANPWIPNRYPAARRSDHVDVYKSGKKGKVSVADPYQWLEHDTEETQKWVDTQEKFTRAYLDKLPDRQKLEEALKKVNDYPRFGIPTLRDDNRWYWSHNSGLQNQYVVYRSKDATPPVFPDSGSSPGEVFFDCNLLSQDGTVHVSTSAHSFDGKYWAYALSESGSDFTTIYVRSKDSPLTATGKEAKKPSHHDGRLPDELKWVKFSGIEWTRDSKGFFYQRYPTPAHAVAGTNGVNGASSTPAKSRGIETGEDKNAKIYYHRLGTSQDEDILVYEDPSHPEWMWGPDVTIDGKYLVLTVSKDSSPVNQLWVTPLEDQQIGSKMKWNKLIDNFDAEYSLICNKGPLFYLKTNKNAPMQKIVAVDINKGIESMKEIIPTQEDALLDQISCVNNDYFAVVYKRNVQSETYIYTLDGKQVTRLAQDFVGTASVSNREKQPWFFVYLTGMTSPGTMGLYDFRKKEGERWSTFYTTRISGLNPEDFESKQLWYNSKDGTRVPMFILRHKSTPLDGTAGCIQYGYGGFNIPIEPTFSPRSLLLCQVYGIIYAQPNIRGGGEFGDKWHQGGIRENKVNVFDDFIAATEFLVKEKYVRAGRTAISGGSNGGLLVSACVNRAPQGTFGAAVADVGVHDMLKFHKFTIGSAWISDYGNPSDPHDFDFIYPISPLHNVPLDRVLPPTMLLTADHDDRVVPAHSFKLAATLQHLLPGNPYPLLLRVDKDAGHGAGKSTMQSIREAADRWAFVANALGLTWRDRAFHSLL